ncbi:MAG: hypothetical protein IJR99_08715 [Kiritimatiellae bacterium]|nr:hypothetical protein [Kiritimatiellia bacterium]
MKSVDAQTIRCLDPGGSCSVTTETRSIATADAKCAVTLSQPKSTARAPSLRKRARSILRKATEDKQARPEMCRAPVTTETDGRATAR